MYAHVFGFLRKGIMKYTKDISTRISVMFQGLKKLSGWWWQNRLHHSSYELWTKSGKAIITWFEGLVGKRRQAEMGQSQKRENGMEWGLHICREWSPRPCSVGSRMQGSYWLSKRISQRMEFKIINRASGKWEGKSEGLLIVDFLTFVVVTKIFALEK